MADGVAAWVAVATAVPDTPDPMADLGDSGIQDIHLSSHTIWLIMYDKSHHHTCDTNSSTIPDRLA